MTPEAVPDIPRLVTGIAEWSAVVIYVRISRPRFPGWAHAAMITAMLPAFIALQLVLGILPLPLWAFGMALAALAMFTAIRIGARLEGKASVYVAARAFVLAEFVQSLHWQLWVHWRAEDAYPVPWTPNFYLLSASIVIVYGTAFVLAYIAERRNAGRIPWLGVDSYNAATAFAIAILAFAFSNVSFVTTETPFSGSTGPDVFYIRTLVAFIGYVALFMQESRRNELRASGELAQTQFIMQRQHAQYLQSKRNRDELRRIHHDLKHYIHAIREEESPERRAEYLAELESTVRGFESEIRTGHAALDIILATQMARCIKEDISFTTMVNGESLAFIDLVSLSAIVGNALDNAVEASMRIPDPDKRIIKLTAFNRQNFVIITVENYWPYTVNFDDGLPTTTKEDRSLHGIGTRSIRTIAQSYSGSATFTVTDDWFTVRILIPQPETAAS